MKVFVLTRGEYSDYRVCGVVATRELAEQIVAKRRMRWDPDDFLEVEVWDAEPPIPPSAWSVTIEVDKSGAVTHRDEVEIRHSAYEGFEEFPRPRVRTWENVVNFEVQKANANRDRLDTLPQVFRVKAVCDDLEGARKAAQDRAAQRQAEIHGLT